MKFTLLFCSMLLTTTSWTDTNEDLVAIGRALEQFARGADQNDSQQQAAVMDESFRVVWNDTSEGIIKVLDRATYLQLIDSKTFGGGNRQLEILSVDLFEGVNATAKVKLSEAGKPTMYSFFSLVKVKGQWLIATDLVLMK